MRRASRHFLYGPTCVTKLLVLLALAITLASTSSVVGQEEAQRRPVDVVLLIDSSGSMETTDPDRFREDAATFLADFLAAAAESVGLRYRMSAAAFDVDVRPEDVPLQDVSTIDLSNIRNLIPDGDTDFGPAFIYALKVLADSYDNDRVGAVVLVTDGQPKVGGQPVPDPEDYFAKVGNEIAKLEAKGVKVFVVGIGEAGRDRERWEEILTEGNFVSIPAPRQLHEVYARWFGHLIGLEAIGDAERLEAGFKETFKLEPFVEHLLVSVVKDNPSVNVVVQDPAGIELGQPQSHAGRGYTVFQTDDPVAGEWAISATGGGISYYVWQRRPTLNINFEPELPWVNGNLVVEVTDLSDRLLEAEDDLQLVVKGDLGGRTVFSEVMERDADRFQASLIGDDLPEVGIYELQVLANVDDELIENLEYETEMVEALVAPGVGSIQINDNLISLDSERPTLEVEPNESLVVVVGVTQPHLLGQVVSINMRRPNGKLVEMEPAKSSVDEETDYSRYTASIVLKEGEESGSLAIQVSGTANTGTVFNDYYVVNVEPLRPPTLEPTTAVAPIVPPTADPKVTITPTSEVFDSGGIIPATRNQFVAVVGVLLVFLGLLGSYLVVARMRKVPDEKYRRLPVQPEGIDVEEMGQRLRDVSKDADKEKVLNEFLEKVDKRLDEAIEPAEEDIKLILAESLKSVYHEGGIVRWDKFHAFWGERFAQENRHRSIYLRVLARFLLSSDGWGSQKDPFFAIQSLYELLQQGLPSDEFVELLAKEDKTTRGLLFGALANVIDYPSDTGFAVVRAHIGALKSESKTGYSSLYDLLKEFYRTPTFSRPELLGDSIISELDKAGGGMKILATLLQEVAEGLQGMSRPQTDQELKRATEKYEKLAAIIDSDKYINLPEAKFLRQRVDIWRQLAQQEARLFESKDEELTPGRLLAEIRPTLDIFESHERLNDDNNWQSLRLPIHVYRIGDSPVIAGEVQSQLKPLARSGSRNGRRFTAGPSKKLPAEFFHEHLDYSPMLLDLTQEVFRPATVSLSLTYERRTRAGTAANLLNEEQDRYEFGSLQLAHEPRRIATADLSNPYISYVPLEEHDLTSLGIRLSLVDDIEKHLRHPQRIGKPNLVSLRGLRWSGKTTTVNALVRRLHAERHTSKSNRRRFITVKINLMDWYERQPAKDKDSNIPEPQLPFMIMLLDQLSHSAKSLGFTPISQQFDDLKRRIAQGIASDLRTIRKPFHDIVKDFMRRDKSKLLLIFDDADMFSYCDNKALYTELVHLSAQAGVFIFLCHDAFDAPWLLAMAREFKSYARQAFEHKQFYTKFMSKDETRALLERGSLKFTDLAVETAWVLTGGYGVLVQHLCYYLIDFRRELPAIPLVQTSSVARAETREGSELLKLLPERALIDEPSAQQVGVTVSSDEVKDFVLDFSDVMNETLSYMVSGFSPEEYLLMLILAAYHTDSDTGILRKIRYDVGRGDRIQIDGLESVLQDLRHFYGDVLPEANVKPLLIRLVERQILENVELPVQKSSSMELPLLRWKVGWLVRYIRQSADADPNSLLMAINQRRHEKLIEA